MRGEKKTENPFESSVTIRKCSGKETQRLRSGLNLYIIVEVLDNLVITRTHHFLQLLHKVVPEPVASAASGIVLKMQYLGPFPRSTE